MAQPIKIQNEPSMDEILASIRRIIEDSESSPVAPSAAPPVAAKAVANDDPAVGARPAPATLRAAEPEPARPQEPVRLSADLARELDRVAASKATPEPKPAPQRPLAGEPQAPVQAPAQASLAAIKAAEGAEPPRTAEKPAAPRTERPAPILSAGTSRQVAAAFEELSNAYAQSRLRSFEEMAEEMLRPMLRDWLDNNLPGLVERLVREEIDRIARGVPR